MNPEALYELLDPRAIARGDLREARRHAMAASKTLDVSGYREAHHRALLACLALDDALDEIQERTQ